METSAGRTVGVEDAIVWVEGDATMVTINGFHEVLVLDGHSHVGKGKLGNAQAKDELVLSFAYTMPQ